MATLDELVARLEAFEAKGDHDGAGSVRRAIVAEYPEHGQAACAQYKLGLDRLFRGRDLQAAATLFEEAAAHGDAFWSAAARVSLGLCLVRLGKAQHGLLELRRVGYGEPATVHSVTALGFIEALMADEGKADEVQRVRRDRIRQLEGLVEAQRQQSLPAGSAGFALLHLALALRDEGEAGRAADLLAQARGLGRQALGEEMWAQLAQASEAAGA